MAILTVGASGAMFKTMTEANAHVGDGDIVQVQAGTYVNDSFQIMHNSTWQAVGGRVVIEMTENLPNQKGILLIGGINNAPNVRIDGFDLTGAKTPAGSNGAGVRFQNGTLTLTNMHIYSCQDGILGTPIYAGTGSITIDRCELDHCGIGQPGQTHCLYANQVATLSVSNSFFHDVGLPGEGAGNLLQSRAMNNTLASSRFYTGTTGGASYNVDFPDAGNVSITGCVFDKTPNSQNPAIVQYGAAFVTGVGTINPGRSVNISGNTFVNSKPNALLCYNYAPQAVNIVSNGVFGLTAAQTCKGLFVASGNTTLSAAPPLDQSHPFDTPAAADEEIAALMLAAEMPDMDTLAEGK